MRKKRFSNLNIFIEKGITQKTLSNIFLVVSIGCGTVTGNPGGGGNSSSLQLPVIDFTLPSEIVNENSEANLTDTRIDSLDELKVSATSFDLEQRLFTRGPTDTPSHAMIRKKPPRRPRPNFKDPRNCTRNLECLAQRMTLSVEGVEQVISELEGQDIGLGYFELQGRSNIIYGSILELKDNVYEYEASICYNGEPFIYIVWNESGQKVEAYRSHNIAPLDILSPQKNVSKLVYEEFDDRIEIEVASDGMNFSHNRNSEDGPYLFENVKAVKYNNDEIKISVVSNWSENSEVENQEGDDYMVAALSEGYNRLAAYHKALPACEKKQFDDTISSPFASEVVDQTWCIARETGFSSPNYQSGDEKFYEILESLSDIKVNSKSSLKKITFPNRAFEMCKI